MEVKVIKIRINLLFMLLVSLSVFNLKAQTSDSLLMQGQVLSSCYVQVNENATASNLDLTGAGHTNTSIGNVQVFSNASATATVIGISDDTGSLLVNQANPAHTIPYTLNYNSTDTGTTVNNLSVPSPSPSTLDFRVGPGGFTGNLGINVTPNPALPDGSYEANVTIACVII